MVRALRKLEVMDAATGTCDCQTLADDGRRRGSLMEGGEGAYAASTALPSAEGRRGNPKAQALTGSRVHPLPPGDRDQLPCSGPNRHRDSGAFVSYFGKWAPGASPASESPSVCSPQPTSPGQ